MIVGERGGETSAHLSPNSSKLWKRGKSKQRLPALRPEHLVGENGLTNNGLSVSGKTGVIDVVIVFQKKMRNEK
jgi:hypothetical protein